MSVGGSYSVVADSPGTGWRGASRWTACTARGRRAAPRTAWSRRSAPASRLRARSVSRSSPRSQLPSCKTLQVTFQLAVIYSTNHSSHSKYLRPVTRAIFVAISHTKHAPPYPARMLFSPSIAWIGKKVITHTLLSKYYSKHYRLSVMLPLYRTMRSWGLVFAPINFFHSYANFKSSHSGNHHSSNKAMVPLISNGLGTLPVQWIEIPTSSAFKRKTACPRSAALHHCRGWMYSTLAGYRDDGLRVQMIPHLYMSL